MKEQCKGGGLILDSQLKRRQSITVGHVTEICSQLNLSPWDDTTYFQCGSFSVNPFLISWDSGIALRNSPKGMPLMFLNPIKVMVQINQNKRSCSPNQCWEKHTQDWEQFLLTSATLKGPGITQAIRRSLENHCLNARELVILAMSLIPYQSLIEL